ncbi:hypothetical protein [Cognatishimia activa]|uniref:Uncharacterized protein n=1 Tax=Cognatishimia activa TaxID=1715691 RepID=A0A0N7MC95_9RHOB|nr:hypothetical protein [Cognatishimia activa]CUJ18033.1 hypothetical protein TA5113_02551 [Cognatishimia activa]CUK27584.1 hypothetical protein TA5114_03412 [Cognatishimia activa]
MVKNSRPFLIFKTAVIGIFGLSRVASAMPIAMNDHVTQVETWRAVKDDMTPHAQGAVPLGEHVKDVIANADLRNDLIDTVELTYSMVSADEIGALDNFWMEVVTSLADASAISTYLSVRASMVDPIFTEGVDSLVWQVQAGGTNCDGDRCNNGGGNGEEGCDASDQENSNDDGDRGGGGGNFNNGFGQRT